LRSDLQSHFWLRSTGELKSESVDVWAAGCVLYTMLCGYQPFSSKYVLELIESIKQREKDPSKRLTIVSALRHKWFNESVEGLKEWKYSHVKFKDNLKRNQRKLTRYPKEVFGEIEETDEVPELVLSKVQKSMGTGHFYSMEDIESGNFSL